MKTSLVAVFAVIVASQVAVRPGSLLSPRMELVYASEGVETPWVVDSVTHDTTFGGRRGCVRMRIRTSPAQQTAETRVFCADSASMYAWNATAGELRASRPLAPNVTVEFVLSGGRKARYETGSATKEVIGGQVIDVLQTTVTTLDSLGRAVSRLRERFSVALATATGGVFEAPDMAAQGGWRVTRKFDLVRIRTP
jgi:hypothetical protein